MRHLFLDTGALKINNVAQQLLDDRAVLIVVHYAFLCSKAEIEQVEKAQRTLLKNLPQKIKKVLSSSVSEIKKNNNMTALTRRSCAGQVIAVGKKVKGIHSGDWVACIADGDNYTDLVCVPEQLVAKVAKKEIIRAASITGLGTIALQAIHRGCVVVGQRVLVVGLDVVGTLIVQLAKLSGCMVIAIDRNDRCLERAQKVGADFVFGTNQEDIFSDIAYLTEHHGVDVTFINNSALFSQIEQWVIQSTRKKGRIVLVDFAAAQFASDDFYHKEIEIIPAGLYGPGYDDQAYKEGHDYPFAHVRWSVQRNMQTFVQLIEREALCVDFLLEKEVTVNQIKQAYNDIHAKQACGVLFRHQLPKAEQVFKSRISKSVKTTDAKERDIRFIPAIKDQIRVGIVGLGPFAKNKLVPILSDMKKVKINAFVDADGEHATRMSELYGAKKACMCTDELLHDNTVDVVMIASPHKFHATQALEALHSGKAVLVEKPMVTDFEQLQKMSAFMQEFPNAPFCIDYNRSFAPFIQKIKKVVRKRRTPLMLQYRINAQAVEEKNWTQVADGTGRIIGDACHIIDLFCFLTDAQPTAVSVEAMHTLRDDIFPTDNFSVQIRFSDGSLCSLFYTALGHKKSSKERMEIFFDSKAIIMNDYVTLEGFGLPSWFNEVVSSPDKGRAHLIDSFLQSVRKECFVAPISFDRMQTVARLTLIIDQLACEGGGTKELSKE